MKDQNWRPTDEAVQSSLLLVVKGCGLCLAVIVGTALGNGVPMARSASQTFEHGMKAGLSKCPCASKRPSTATVASLRPESVPQPAVALPTPTPIVAAGQVVSALPVLSLEVAKEGKSDEGSKSIE